MLRPYWDTAPTRGQAAKGFAGAQGFIQPTPLTIQTLCPNPGTQSRKEEGDESPYYISSSSVLSVSSVDKFFVHAKPQSKEGDESPYYIKFFICVICVICG
jgi:hypothetical protein